MKVYLRELTPKQMQEYAAELHTCKFCNSVELVVSNYVGDAICEDCGKWQGDAKLECPNHKGSFDCTPFCALCAGDQEIRED